ncbi:hypothetical protein [Maricaulis salignorans]|uniref:Uncharacterized protein n=1 Tax=Maricaulis salignorans TaxID=144026 RepID=A0A1G9VWA9_9PROT|nr:hypothetical protein [Maricaulis salignorans]SDM76221.1 hypothetical protein SAMN04488568_12118 [Maricaulis salignorans]
MVSRFALAAAVSILASGAVSAQALQDSQSWTTRIGETGDSGLLRWHFSSEEAAPAIGLLPSTPILETDITTLTGQVDFFPFGDEFYLSAGAVRPLYGNAVPAWNQQAGSPAWAGFPHAELTEDLRETGLEKLTSYLGAGITVRNLDQWSLTVEGGAYFQDRGRDRLQILDQDTGETMTLLDDLDNMDREAVGETQARSFRPVAHLVIRRRF